MENFEKELEELENFISEILNKIQDLRGRVGALSDGTQGPTSREQPEVQEEKKPLDDTKTLKIRDKHLWIKEWFWDQKAEALDELNKWGNGEITKKTPKAVLVENDTLSVWIPRSMIVRGLE